MSTGKTTECRKFSPNIFNKSKCQHCFACKDSHSAEALDNNRVSRKISKCGYLFVAPDWDFTDPINRSKRWQRRWFVLFDDGELTYSVDEHAETVPQAIIDMTKVLEVSNAEDVTGNQFAIAIVAPERVHFVKGTSREESKWWFDVLAVFPRSIKGSRHKRNATFPGTTATTTVHPLIEDLSTEKTDPTKSIRAHGESKNESSERICGNNRESSNIVNTNNKRNNIVSSSSQRNSEVDRRRHPVKRGEFRGAPSQRSLSDGVSFMIPRGTADMRLLNNRPRDAFIITVNNSCGGKSLTANTEGNAMPPLCRGSESSRKPISGDEVTAVPRLIDKRENRRSSPLDGELGKPRHVEDVHGVKTSTPNSQRSGQIRGDPDGCGLDKTDFASSDVTEEEVKIKKGWLMKREANNEWNNVWCVLSTSALRFYEDSSDEANGLATGVVNMARMDSIQKLPVAGHYSFQLKTLDGNTHLFSAMTATLRANWISAFQSTIGIPSKDSVSEPIVSLGEKIEKEMSLLSDPGFELSQDLSRGSIDVPSSPRSVLSSDDEFKTASEASGRTEDYFEWADEDVDQTANSSRALPPSPPLNRTPISRVKERARTRTTSRGSLHLEGPPKGNSSQRKADSKDDLSGSDRETSGTPKNGRRQRENRRRDSRGLTSDVPESMLVERLQMEVESLKDQLEQYQLMLVETGHFCKVLPKGEANDNLAGSWQQKAEWNREFEGWQKRQADLLSKYHGLRKRMELLEETSVFTDRERHLLLKCETLEEKYQADRFSWENKRKILEDEWNARICDQQKTIDSLEERLKGSEAKIVNLIEEMDTYCQQQNKHDEELRATSKCFESPEVRNNKERWKTKDFHVESLSDLSDVSFLDDSNCQSAVEELKNRLRVTVVEIKALQQEIRESQGANDDLEMRLVKLRQQLDAAEEDHKGQMRLMTERVEDLTTKLSTCEKQNRQLRQKLVRGENKEQRRTRSLKGKEIVAMSKELEAKASELERRVYKGDSSKDCKVSPAGDDCEGSVKLSQRIEALEFSVEKAREKMVQLKRVDVTIDGDCERIVNSNRASANENKEDFGDAEEMLNRLQRNLAEKMAFFKERETMLAQLGLLNKQSLFRLNLERIVHEANLIGQISGVLMLKTRRDVVRPLKRLSHQLSLFEKKLAGQSGNEDCGRNFLQWEQRIRQLVNSHKATRVETIFSALLRKMTSNQLKKGSSSSKVDVLSQKVAEVEMRRMVSGLVHLKTQEVKLGSAEDPESCKLIADIVQDDGKTLVADLQQRLRQSVMKPTLLNDSGSIPTGNVDQQLSEFVEIVAEGSVLLARAKLACDSSLGNQSSELSPSLSKMAEDAAIRELNLFQAGVDSCVSTFVSETRAKSCELSAEWPKDWKRSVEDILKSSSMDGKPSFFLNTYEERTRRSFRQRSQRSMTMPICCPLTEAQTVKEPGCEECKKLKGKLEEVKKENEEQKAQVDLCLQDKIKELEDLKSQLNIAEQKLSAKEAERFQQISALKEAYGRENAWKSDSSSINEEAVRQRYQAEIEQLRGLCEKGLVAMENSHRRIIAELEEKHQRELEQILVEKEQALAEETQATLAALDAMRKAHEDELQREIAKFKRDFVEKMQSTDNLQKEQEEEMETIKKEILSLSEKYSVKCLENASLEERLKIIVQQMADANSLAFDLTARNKQLRAALNTQTNELRSRLDDQQCQFQLKLTMNELKEKEEQVADMQQLLQEARRHEANLEAQRQQLDQSLKAERRLRQDEVSSLRDRLEHIILTGNASLEAAKFSSKLQAQHTGWTDARRPTVQGRELMRSPSCPGLSNAIPSSTSSAVRRHLCEP